MLPSSHHYLILIIRVHTPSASHLPLCYNQNIAAEKNCIIQLKIMLQCCHVYVHPHLQQICR